MRIALLTLFATLAFDAPAADFSGRWKLLFTGTQERPKMVPEVILDIEAKDGRLTGTAHMGAWPGDAPLIDGKINGNRISFTVIGDKPWWRTGGIDNASGLPKLTFTGTIHANEMQLKLIWDSVMIYGSAPVVREYEMKGAKSAN